MVNQDVRIEVVVLIRTEYTVTYGGASCSHDAGSPV